MRISDTAAQPTPVVVPEEECKDCLDLLKERDDLEERLDKLAEAVSEHFEVPIGEHSSANDPIQVAFEILGGGYKTKYDAPVVVRPEETKLGGYRVELVEEDGQFTAHHPDLRGCASFGDSPNEAIAGLAVVRKLWLEGKLTAQPAPLPSDQNETFDEWWDNSMWLCEFNHETLIETRKAIAKKAWNAAKGGTN